MPVCFEMLHQLSLANANWEMAWQDLQSSIASPVVSIYMNHRPHFCSNRVARSAVWLIARCTAGGSVLASSFLKTPHQEDTAGSQSLTRLAEEDLFVASNEGLLVRHRLSMLRPAQQPGAPDTDVGSR